MKRAFWLLFVLLWASAGRAATPTVAADTYRAQLQSALKQLQTLENRPPRDLGAVLKPLETPQIVKRSDGATQTQNGVEWTRRRGWLRNPKIARHEEVSAARQSVEARLKALDEWAKPQNGAFFKAADAQNIFAGLEKEGQFSIGPGWWEQKMADWTKSIGDAITAFGKWLEGLFPHRAPSAARIPNWNFNWTWLQWLFWGLVAALLGLVGLLLYRALAGQSWGRRGARRDVSFEGEDAELLLLPPDELRDRANNYAAQGNFREALRHLYISLLLQFDGRGVWRYDTRRTNWEHIAALRKTEAHRPLVAPLSDLTRRFDRVRYGGAPCENADWERFSGDVERLEAQIGANLVGGHG